MTNTENKAFAIAARRMWKNGLTCQQIADALSFSTGEIVDWLATDNHPRRAGQPEKPERNAEILRRRQEGAKLRDIAGEFGISQPRVHQIITKAMAKAATVAAPRPAEARLISKAAQEAAARRAKWLAIARQNVSH